MSEHPVLKAVLALTIGLSSLWGAPALGLDYPHSDVGGCTSCHFPLSPDPDLMPPYLKHEPTFVGDTQHNSLCRSCHNDLDAPFEETHSSRLMENPSRGDWYVECRTCHNPHQQRQFRAYGDAAYLYSGPSAAITPTSIQKQVGAAWVVDEFKGMVVVPNVDEYDFNYKIIGNTTDTLNVEGPINLSHAITGDTFAIVYGRAIREVIVTPSSGQREVKFFRPEDANSFADGDATRDGVCEVCHTDTTHYRGDGLGADQSHGNLGTGGANGDRCVRCHQHKYGFKHKGGWGTGCEACHGTSGSHAPHMGDLGLACDRCHQPGNYPFFRTGTDANGDGRIDLAETTVCDSCHSDGAGGPPNETGFKAGWATGMTLSCDSCHRGRSGLDPLEMNSRGHAKLVGSDWIRQYSCWYCHADTVDAFWNVTSKHVNGVADVATANPKWAIKGWELSHPPGYIGGDCGTKDCDICTNTYCHSDGRVQDPEVKDVSWNNAGQHLGCNACHGHRTDISCVSAGCHDTDETRIELWGPDDSWKSSMPMYENTGPGTSKQNSHPRHLLTEFSCENCHALTVVGDCKSCHGSGIPPGSMGEVGHVDAKYHDDKNKNVNFKLGGTYDDYYKTCSGTNADKCHGGNEPTWGAKDSGAVICLSCHGTTEGDKDDYGSFNGQKAAINLTQWVDTGHGRPSAKGTYKSGNPAANFPGNPCWYCHDRKVLHDDARNPFRLRKHPQFERRFEKECVYCHMERKDYECRSCHNDQSRPLTISPQLLQIGPEAGLKYPCSRDHRPYASEPETSWTTCLSVTCHPTDAKIHRTGSEYKSTVAEKADIKNMYVLMGVCLKCHDDDAEHQCGQCHTEGGIYSLGYDPGDGLITAASKVTSSHFGYKHYAAFEKDGTWKGGKFCWDCHDSHGDGNALMMHDNVSTSTDGTFGIPRSTARVIFPTDPAQQTIQSGGDFVRLEASYATGLCNACHTVTSHYRSDAGDGHMSSRPCTNCHEHRFGASHAGGKQCSVCHEAKPIPRHSGMGQPRGCVQCHDGILTPGNRIDIMGQFRSVSHHVQFQGTQGTVGNEHCYQCHWEATEHGLIDPTYHQGYNNQTHETVHDAEVDLVVAGARARPTTDIEGVTRVTFTATKMGTAEERAEVGKISQHCLSCHSDQNNEWQPFGDCRTPNQYAWDRTSIAARYSDTGTTTWGKYTGPQVAGKQVVKAFSAHGMATANAGGWDTTTGEDNAGVNTRAGSVNVECFDCHNSHGSKTSGVTSSYVTFNGTLNGGNLKETQSGKGGYLMKYAAVANPSGVNPYAAGAAQCIDCHETAAGGTVSKKPWGYNSTFGASQPILGYRDTPKFGTGFGGKQQRYAYKQSRPTVGGHLKASGKDAGGGLKTEVKGAINGLCTPCHDPHGVSPTLGDDRGYGVPLLKGTWLTSPYKEDAAPPPAPSPPGSTTPEGAKNAAWASYWSYGRYQGVDIDIIQGYSIGANAGVSIAEDESRFGGLCLRCHEKTALLAGTNGWKSTDRIHKSVRAWGTNLEHAFPCSKCHAAHVSGLPKLMKTNCLDFNHRGRVASNGIRAWYADMTSTTYYKAHGSGNVHMGFPNADTYGKGAASPTYKDAPTACHYGAAGNTVGVWPSRNYWNSVTPW